MAENLDCIVHPDSMYVKDADGKKHLYTKNNHRTKLYDKVAASPAAAFEPNNNQITKSCHVCQDQHVKFKCQASETCSYSFCERCLRNYHWTFSLEQVIAKCPVCRGVCSCRACLRKMWNPKLKLDQDPEENKAHAEHILKCCGPFIQEILTHYDEEALQFGEKLEVVHVEKPDNDFITCDRCSTSIPDLHMACRNCREGREICMSCVTECRGLGQKTLDKTLTCGSCDSQLRLTRLMSTDMLRNMRKIAKLYGDNPDRPRLPRFSYPRADAADCPVEVDFDFGNDAAESLRVKVLVKRDPDVEMCPMNEAANRMTCKLEVETEHLVPFIEWREAGGGNGVRCVDANVCSKEDVNKLLQLCMWIGAPLVVKNAKGVMDWRPQTMSRVFVDRKGNNRLKKSKKSGRARVRETSDDEEECKDLVGPDDVCVILCSNNWQMEYWRQHEFFSIYENGTDSKMYKIKDWPPDDLFVKKLTRHYQDFVESLPFACYTNPVSGMLNLTTALPEYRCRPDLGPKSYLATGRVRERCDGTDSVTKLHLDMTDAVNILVHAQCKYKGDEAICGAVWTIIDREDVAAVTEYLRDPDALSEKKTYLKEEDRMKLVETHGVKIWTFEQFQNDAVYVPSGCPHQVRNIRSCLKVAMDFFPPESAAVVMGLTEYRRQFAKRVKNDDEKDVFDTLQGQATMMYACNHAYKITSGRETHFPIIGDPPKRKWSEVEKDMDSDDDMEIDESAF